MHINITDEVTRNTMLSHILMDAMGAVVGEDGDILEHFHLKSDRVVGVWGDIKLVINGKECDLEGFAKAVEESLDKMVQDEASKLIDEARDNLNEKVENLMADLKAKMGLRECTCHRYE